MTQSVFSSADFNRFTVHYTANAPAVLTLHYLLDGAPVHDEFFLEENASGVASGLLSGYLDGKKGAGPITVTARPCRKNEPDFSFSISSLTTEICPVYADRVFYLENERYKVGIQLRWGGGICYIQDKKAPSGLVNLVNQADTGRLIQQSYYGTKGNEEYKPGYFNHADWSYNPVQGGDVGQYHSRIIDIQVHPDSVYIKSQPQDWSLRNHITPSYMENLYTISSDFIRVDNRFVDFSGWEHRWAAQELPAFYTISYLDTFTWYDGIHPWTGEPLRHRSDLSFWGDARYSDDCTFPIRQSNTEVWSAWTHGENGFGIGLFVPETDILFAGRNAYNGSRDPDDEACNYTAPLNTIWMPNFKPIEYSYLLTTGTVAEIRATFTKHKDFTDNAVLRALRRNRRIPDTAE